MIQKVNLTDKFARFQDTWSPKIVGELNDSHVKLAKLQGEFVWHHHDQEDELFLVVSGHLIIRLRDGDIHLDPGEFVIIPHGVEHLPTPQPLLHHEMRREHHSRYSRVNLHGRGRVPA